MAKYLKPSSATAAVIGIKIVELSSGVRLMPSTR
jgi:hypothetical protein